MATKSKYRTVSIPTGITDAIEEIMDELGYWPSVGSFIREAALDKLRNERKLLKELREDEGKPINSGVPASEEEESHGGGNRSVPRG